jgi:predicted TIM-barrel fold metal-dependent hydrolase
LSAEISPTTQQVLRAGLVDADVHVDVPGLAALRPYLPPHWLEYIELSGYRGPATGYHPPALLGAPGIADLPGLRDRLLDREPVAVAILNCCSAIDSIRDHELASAIAAATNDWLAAEWLAPDDRVRGSLVVPVQAPDLAAAEIDRWAGDRRFVQVLLPVRSAQPYGARIYRPLLEAATRAGLVVGLHFGGAPANPTTPVGWASLFIEEYAAMAGAFATQLTSLVADGALARHPDLRLTLIESGVSWLPGHLWKADMYWRGMRRLIPWVRRAPSAYIREQVRLTLAPFDAPPDRAGLEAVIRQLGSDDLLLYASAYPVRTEVVDLLDAVAPATAGRVRRQNAVNWYRLEEWAE